MKAGQIIGAVLDTVFKIVIIGVIVTYTYKYALQAYDFGYRVFAEGAVSTPETAKTISIYIPEDATAMEVGEALEENGLIKDARLFLVQEFLSGHHGELREGRYELSSDMTSEEMIKILTAEPAAEDSTASSEESAAGTPEEDLADTGEQSENGDTPEEDLADTGEQSEGGGTPGEGQP